MALSAPRSRSVTKRASLSWPWRITIVYLLLMLVLPISALLTKAASLGWASIWEIATDPIAISTYQITIGTALIAALINGVAGLATAWVLVRYEFPYKPLLDGLLDLPFALPSAVAGLTLATLYSDNGWLGAIVAPFGIKIAFTRLGVGVAMLFASLPFVVRSVQPVLQDLDEGIEQAAWSLGASQWQTFTRVVLPPLLPALLTGMALGFSRAVGEYGAVVLIAGNRPFEDLIASVLIIQRLEQYDLPGATVIGTVMLLLSLVFLLMINFIQAWGRRYES
jgi:sulfate/thiosulfate transport system permease protein